MEVFNPRISKAIIIVTVIIVIIIIIIIPRSQAQSSSEDRIKLNIPLLDGCWVAVFEFIGCWCNCSGSFKWLSWVSELLLLVVECWILSTEWCFVLYDRGELLEASSMLVILSEELLVLCSVIFCVRNLGNYRLSGSTVVGV